MAQRTNWIAVAITAIGSAISLIAAIVAYLHFTTTALHVNPQDVPSETRSAPDPRWKNAVDSARQIVRDNIVKQEVPAISVAVGVNGAIVWAEGFGWANITERSVVGPDTRFRIGHVSTALTSAAAGMLRERGLLHLDADVQDYVPAFPKKQWPVTLRQLMAHMAGIHHYKDTEWGDKPATHCDRASDGVAAFANDPLLFQPETKFSYSTYGWVLVSAAIEAGAKMPFAQFMRANVFEPAGMTQTTFDAPHEGAANQATPYYRGNLGRELTTNTDYSCFAGGGAIVSTPSDLARFGLAMIGGTLLNRDTVSLLQTRQLTLSGEGTGYGLGWTLEDVELAGVRTRLAGSASRMIEGASTSFLTFPDRGLVVAVSSNMSFADMRSVAMAIAEAFAK